ncbi:hypothetical protein BGX31_006810 [Mortierella sp. GBA43]|nr:hypothetical protein BGX31_006810 [Mortierella sp. GBA43]
MPGLNIVEHNNTRYRVRVSAGPSLQQMRPLSVNDDANPFGVDSDEFSGHVLFRIKGQDQIQGYEEGQRQDGLQVLKDSPWFGNAAVAGRGDNLLSCLQVVGRFKREWSLNLPPLSSVAVKFFKALDPAVQLEVTGSKPYYISPLLSAMNTVSVSKDPLSSLIEQGSSATEASLPPPTWPSSNGEVIVEETSLIMPEETDAAGEEEGSKTKKLTMKLKMKKSKVTPDSDPATRRKHFNKAKNLVSHRFLKDHVYSFELFNPFLDCSRFSLKLPVLALDLYKPLDGQPITYAFQTQDGSATFLVVAIELVPVECLATV